jgi:hypothetical protein
MHTHGSCLFKMIGLYPAKYFAICFFSYNNMLLPSSWSIYMDWTHFFFYSTGVWIEGFALNRQMLCHLSHSSCFYF